MVKAKFPKALVVVGGPHLSIYPKESLTWDCFDLAVVGPGAGVLGRAAARRAGVRAVPRLRDGTLNT
jgi:radical SAM superfamily enzyme YgiQ (UPF0313 family)